jgi:hypothetical protein
MTQTLRPGNTIDHQLDLYQQQAVAWKGQEKSAADAVEVDALLGFGLHLYDAIRRADRRWADTAGSGAPVREEDARRLESWYRSWSQAASAILGRIRELQGDGECIDRADEFRRASLEVRSALSIPVERAMAPDDPAAIRRTSAEAHDALRGHLAHNR